MAFVFIKQFIGKIVSAIGGFTFGKLSPRKNDSPSLALSNGKIDISKLELPPGVYTITVTACAEGLKESQHSNAELIVIKRKK